VFGRDAEGNLGGYEMMLGDQGLPDEAEEGEKFGKALAAGDFNADGRADLAIGVPQEDLLGTGGVALVNSGVVNVLYGAPSGISTLNDQVWGQGGLNPSGS
jgi:hypothetical protein